MAETKDDIAAERDRLREENERLRGQLAAAGAATGRVAQAAPRRPWLSEGERQDLAATGVTNSPFTGEQLTTDTARAKLTDDQRNVDIPEPKEGARVQPAARRREQQAREGVDYVYPSVAPHVLADDAQQPVPVDTGVSPVDGK